jgi:alpha-tubulin suppressor-like RCC1 family protein
LVIRKLNKIGLGDIINRYSPTFINSLFNINKISSGNGFSLALNTSGNVFVFGSNNVKKI